MKVAREYEDSKKYDTKEQYKTSVASPKEMSVCELPDKRFLKLF